MLNEPTSIMVLRPVSGDYCCPSCNFPMCGEPCASDPRHADQECSVFPRFPPLQDCSVPQPQVSIIIIFSTDYCFLFFLSPSIAVPVHCSPAPVIQQGGETRCVEAADAAQVSQLGSSRQPYMRISQRCYGCQCKL